MYSGIVTVLLISDKHQCYILGLIISLIVFQIGIMHLSWYRILVPSEEDNLQTVTIL